jgi:type IV pilus assembly protein PilE
VGTKMSCLQIRIRRALAFSLIELLITIAVVAILVAIAVPSYRSFIVRANRTEGIDAVLASIVCQERIYSRVNAYDATECAGATANGLYVVTIATQNSNQNITITATPQAAQVNDGCGVLALNEKGIKKASGSSGVAAEKCWAGK